MIGLRLVPPRSRGDLRDDRCIVQFLVGERLYQRFGCVMLGRVAVEDRGAILSSPVVSLTIQSGGIVNGEKDFEERLE